MTSPDIGRFAAIRAPHARDRVEKPALPQILAEGAVDLEAWQRAAKFRQIAEYRLRVFQYKGIGLH